MNLDGTIVIDGKTHIGYDKSTKDNGFIGLSVCRKMKDGSAFVFYAKTFRDEKEFKKALHDLIDKELGIGI